MEVVEEQPHQAGEGEGEVVVHLGWRRAAGVVVEQAPRVCVLTLVVL
jgi:hypothetical protein